MGKVFASVNAGWGERSLKYVSICCARFITGRMVCVQCCCSLWKGRRAVFFRTQVGVLLDLVVASFIKTDVLFLCSSSSMVDHPFSMRMRSRGTENVT